MLSPLLCGSSGLDKVLEPIKGSSHLSRVKTVLSSSPLGRRRRISSGSSTSSLADSNLASPQTGLVWGVPLEVLVEQNKSKGIPFIVERIIGCVERHGLHQEGLYRVNGNAKVIEKLKASFDRAGDANFNDVDVAAVGGLLKLFLRDIPVPLITEDVITKFVALHENAGTFSNEEYYEQIRSLLKQLPAHHYHLLRYLLGHLVTVAKHEVDNKMSPVSLSIVFGPNIFRCEGGLAGLQRQGVCNSFLSKMIMKYDTVLMDDDRARANQVKEEAIQRRGRPQHPQPYSVYMENLNSLEELNDGPSDDTLSSSWGHGSFSSSTHPKYATDGVINNERNIDECIANLPLKSHEQLTRSQDSDPDFGTGRFLREMGIRRRPSLDGVKRNSLSPSREDELSRTPSPWSQMSNSSISPNSSPVQATSHVMSQYLAAVIEQTVRQLLFGQGSSLSVPTKPVSSARQRRKVSSGIKANRDTTSDLTVDTLIAKDNSSSTSMVEAVAIGNTSSDTPDGDSSHRVIMRRGSSKEERDRKRGNRESGALFSDSINITIDQSSVDGNTEFNQSEEATKPHHKKRKPAVKGFDLFESSGLILGAPPIVRTSKSSAPAVLLGDKGCSHFVMTSLDEEDSLSQSTGAYSVQLVAAPLTEDDLNVVKNVDTLNHPTLSRPRPPANRRSPGRRGVATTDSSTSLPTTTSTVTTTSVCKRTVPCPKPRLLLDESAAHTKSLDVISSTTTGRTAPKPKPKPKHHSDVSRTLKKPDVQATADVATSAGDLHTSVGKLHTKSVTSANTEDVINFCSKPYKSSADNIDASNSSNSNFHVDSNISMKSTNNLHTQTGISPESGTQSHKTEVADTSNSKTIVDSSISGSHATGDHVNSASHPHNNPDSHTNPDSHAKSSTAMHTLDVVADQFVGVADTGWSSTHKPIDAGSDAVSEQSKRLKEIKRLVRQYEIEYKAQHGGAKPSGADKDPIRPLMREYFSIKQQLQLTTDSSDELLSKTAPAKLSGGQDQRKVLIDHNSDEVKAKQAALNQCQQELADKRKEASRPDSVDHMSFEQLREEKLSVQKVLLSFESEHGRPQTEAGKEVMRPLYNYYRQLKKLIGGLSSTDSNKSELALTTVSMATQKDDRKHLDSGLLSVSLGSCDVIVPVSDTAERVTSSQRSRGDYPFSSTEDMLSSSSDSSSEQLREQLTAANAEKHKLKQAIHKHEADFLQQYSRPLKERDDRLPIQHHYDAYKRVKAHIKLIETLLAKKDSNITV